MSLNTDKKSVQWSQLLAVAAIHFLADMFGGMLPAILPAIRDEFNFSLKLGLIIVSTHYISCNVFQVLTGHLREKETKPLFLIWGIFFAASLSLMGILPADSPKYQWLNYSIILLLTLLSGYGISILHPESFRAVHSLKKLPAATTTAIFMAFGFIGFASGGYIAAYLVANVGFPGLLIMLTGPVIAIILIKTLNIKLAVEDKREKHQTANVHDVGINFWWLWLIAIPSGIATTFLMALLPTHLNNLGYSLEFGGFSTMMMGLGGAAGSFLFGWYSHKRSELKTAAFTLIAGVPLFYLYLSLIESKTFVVLLFIAGFLSVAAFPLIITLARYGTGLNLGHRMGIMLGGSWGLASVILMAAGPLVEKIGIMPVLWTMPAGYLIAGLIAVKVYRDNRERLELCNPKTKI